MEREPSLSVRSFRKKNLVSKIGIWPGLDQIGEKSRKFSNNNLSIIVCLFNKYVSSIKPITQNILASIKSAFYHCNKHLKTIIFEPFFKNPFFFIFHYTQNRNYTILNNKLKKLFGNLPRVQATFAFVYFFLISTGINTEKLL